MIAFIQVIFVFSEIFYIQFCMLYFPGTFQAPTIWLSGEKVCFPIWVKRLFLFLRQNCLQDPQLSPTGMRNVNPNKKLFSICREKKCFSPKAKKNYCARKIHSPSRPQNIKWLLFYTGLTDMFVIYRNENLKHIKPKAKTFFEKDHT